ncbi:MAG: response regulator transcription factor [Clostridiales bacterium]|nr:response regulator transcription factor [Clostridiales bacterium]
MKPKILIIEDEKPIADILQYGMTKESFEAKCVYTGSEGFLAMESFQPDLVLLDWMLPDINGVTVCQMITEKYNVPIIMLTAKGSMDDKLLGLEAGADDYITKPFDLREVVARCRGILRRMDKVNQRQQEPKIYGEGIQVRREEHMVLQHGKTVDLTPKEYDLLLCFLEHPRMVQTREILLEQVWGYDYPGDTRTVDIHVQRLRKKLELGGSLCTVYGVGYKYVPEESQ